MKKTLLMPTAAIILLTFIFTACAPAENTDISAEKPMIAVSIAPQASFVKAVCGDKADVITMVPAGSSPSNYEPSPAEMEAFAKADIYFSIGVPTEVNNILPFVAENTSVTDMAAEVSSVHEDVLLDGSRDPHIWLSPKRVQTMTDIICRQMSALDPDNAQFYADNAAAFQALLQQLDADINAALADVENRKFIVFHPAFGYLADDYDLTMYALEEHGKEATAGHLQEMIDLAKEENIKVIFYQAEIDSNQSRSFAEEIGGTTVMLDPLSENYLENMKLMAETMAEVME